MRRLALIRERSTGAALSLLPIATPPAHATSRTYSTLDQLIASSDVIAVVTIEIPNKESRRFIRFGQSFRCASPAKVENLIKGLPPAEIVIYHESALDDQLFQQGPGKYVVFLKMKNGLLTPTDGWPSSKLATAGSVAGWSDRHTFARDFAPLQEVIAEIKGKIASGLKQPD